MARSFSPALSTELENLGKDMDTRKSAMKALTSYVRDLDSRAIPLFVARVSETKDASGGSSGEYTIPLYEDLARAHGPNIVSQIDIIMGTVIRFLTTSGGSIPLQQACSKVAPTIARYAIEPATPEDKKKHIIRMLCKPLCDSVLGSQESLSCGAALCLKTLVDCDNWRFASDEMVNEVCLKVAGALKDKATQTNSHMGLVMSLAEHNSLVVEAYAGLLICSGLEILNAGVTERNSQKRLMAIQMISFLMKCLDIRGIYSELELIIEEMEKCQTDEVIYVRGASYEALEIARKLIVGKGPEFDPDVVSVTGSNGNSGQRCNLADGNHSPESLSPDYQTFDSFVDNNTLLVDSPFSTTRASCNVDRSGNTVSRKLWRAENGGVDISLKDGILSEIARRGGAPRALSEHCEASNSLRGYDNGFHGFYPGTPSKGGFRSQTPSPRRQRPQMNARSVNIYGTPTRQFVRFQDEEHENTDFYENQARRITSPCSVKCGCSSPVAKYNSNSLRNGAVHAHEINGNFSDKGQLSQSDSESMSSTEDVPVAQEKLTGEISQGRKEHNKMVKKTGARTAMKVLYSILLLLLAVVVSVFLLDNEQEELHLVPT